MKKRIRRGHSWLLPMWREIYSLRKQNALSKLQNETLRKENEAIEKETVQIERETEQLRNEAAILRRQNKALALLESSEFHEILSELSGDDCVERRDPLDGVNVDLLCQKLIDHGCHEEDIPFLLSALELDVPSQRRHVDPSPLRDQVAITSEIEEAKSSGDLSVAPVAEIYRFPSLVEARRNFHSHQDSKVFLKKDEETENLEGSRIQAPNAAGSSSFSQIGRAHV